MTFMPDIETECPVCNGMRFNEELLAVQFQGHTIANILDMTVSDAIALFQARKEDFCTLGFNETSWFGIFKVRAIYFDIIGWRSATN